MVPDNNGARGGSINWNATITVMMKLVMRFDVNTICAYGMWDSCDSIADYTAQVINVPPVLSDKICGITRLLFCVNIR